MKFLLTSKLLLLFLFVFLLSTAIAQSKRQKRIDSLKNLVKIRVENDSIQQAISALHDLTNEYEYEGKWDEYYETVNLMIKYSNQIGDSYRISECYNKLGIAASLQGDNKNALVHFKKTIELNKELKDTGRLGNSYENIAMVYKDMGKYEQAVSHQIKSITLRKEVDDSRLFNNYIGLCLLYGLLKDDDKQDEYIKLAKKRLDNSKKKDYAQYAIYYNEIADVYEDRGMIDSTIACYKNVIKYSEKIEWQQGIMVGMGNLAGMYMETGEYEKAIDLHKKSLAISIKIDNCMSIAEEYFYLAELYLKTGKSNLALEYNNKAIAYSTKCDLLKELSNSYLLQSMIYESRKDYKLAYKNHVTYHELIDSIASLENKQHIAELETQHRTREKEQEIELLNTKNQTAEKEKHNQFILFSALAIILLLVVMVFVYLYRNNRKTARELKKLGEMKSRFFSNISHELRTPLTLIDGPVKSLLQNETSEENKNYLKLIDRNSQKLLEKVNQLLELSKIDAGHFNITVNQDDLSLFVRHIAGEFEHLSKSKDINYSVTTETTDLVWFDKNTLEIILINLLSNAFKFVDERKEISVSMEIIRGIAQIQISNTSITVSKSDINQFFDRFYRGTDKVSGTGIGLSLVKELIDLYRGSISANYTHDGKMLITIQIPVEKKQFKTVEIAKETSAWSFSRFPINSEIDHSKDINKDENEKPVLLIVEDNTDMRTYIASCFAGSYSILLAEDGVQGLELATTHIPDLIISDRMMPMMDGIELCNKLKKQKSTSHIPVILLTALVGEEHTLKGLQHKADEYITKPFSTQILKLKVQNLLELSFSMRSKYSRELLINPINLILPSSEEQFAMDLQTILNDHITNPDFNVEQFCSVTNLSRTQLHRKITSVTGQSATAFIRTQRVKMAADLLKSKSNSISDVCYGVGFNDTSYFTKCFKDILGSTPKAFQSQLSEN
jgi:signal transduction histidine kinase/DNA-binding response OmpR family regulator